MKLPFVVVPRAIYEQMLTERAQLRGDIERRDDELRTQRDIITRMKLSGAALVTLNGGVADRPKPEPRERTPFEEAVDANPRCKADPKTRAHCLRWADDTMRAARATHGDDPEQLQRVEDAILDRLRGWHLVTEHDDEDDEDDSVVPIG